MEKKTLDINKTGNKIGVKKFGIKKETGLKLLSILLILMIVFMVAPVVIGAGYTYLCEDDYSFEAGANDAANSYSNPFIGALHKTYSYALSNQGTYLFSFLIHFLRPYSIWGLTGFHFVMICIALFYILSLFYMVHNVCYKSPVAFKILVMFAAAFASFGLRGTDKARELFFWYTGALNFTVEMSFMFLTVSLMLIAIRMSSVDTVDKEALKKKKMWILAAGFVTGLLASGGALEVTSPNCAFLLAIILIDFDVIKSDRILTLPFIGAFVGALINVAAPGNYVRATSVVNEGHETVLDAIRDTFVVYGEETIYILRRPLFLLVLAVILTAGIYTGLKIRKSGMTHKWMIICIAGVFAMQFLTMFPVIFGYHEASLKNYRTTACYEILARLMYMFLVMCLGQYIGEIRLRKSVSVGTGKIVCAACTVLIGASIIFGVSQGKKTYNDYNKSFSAKIITDLRTGTMQNLYNARMYILSTLELAEDGSDVVIHVNVDVANESMYGMGLMDDSGWFVNNAASGLFGVNSISVIYGD